MRQFVGFDVTATDEVSACWRWLPLVCYLLTCVASIACSVAMGTVTSRFQDQCPLFAQPVVSTFDGVNVTLNEHSSSEERTHWGDMQVCYVAQFLPVFCVIFSVAWFFFFCMCGKGGRGSAEGFGMDSPWRIVCPGVFFNLGMMIGYLISSIWLTQGIAVFCDGLAHFNVSCTELNRLHFVGYPRLSNLGTWFSLAEACSWLSFSGLLLVTLLLVARCFVRPDLTPLYEPVADDTTLSSPIEGGAAAAARPADPEGDGVDGVPAAEDLRQRTSSAETFATADTSPTQAQTPAERRSVGPAGDVIVHASA